MLHRKDKALNTSEPTYEQIKKTARLAGFIFIFFSVPLATWSQSYVASKIFVQNSPSETASNLLANEFLFRTGIASHLTSSILFALSIFLLYKLFKPIDSHLSRLMISPVIAQIAVFLVLEIFNLTALLVLKNDRVVGFNDAQKQEISFLLLRMYRLGIGASQLFWGLCFIPFGMLAYKSGFLPRILGILLIISGIGYITDGFTFILLQRTDYLRLQPFVRITFIGFLLTMLWLLIKGVYEYKSPSHQ